MNILPIIPLEATFYVFYDKTSGKIYLSIYLFNTIKLICGYFELKIDGIFFHLSDKKAIIFPFKNLFNVKNELDIFKGYKIKDEYSQTVLGFDDDILKAIYFNKSLQILIDMLTLFVKNKHMFGKAKNDFISVQNQNLFNIYLKFTVKFNLFLIMVSILKILIGKFQNATKRQSKFFN